MSAPNLIAKILWLFLAAQSCLVLLFPSQYDLYSLTLGPLRLSSMVEVAGVYVYLSELLLICGLTFAASVRLLQGSAGWRLPRRYFLSWLVPSMIAYATALLQRPQVAMAVSGSRPFLLSGAFVLGWWAGQTDTDWEKFFRQWARFFGILLIGKAALIVLQFGESPTVPVLLHRSGDLGFFAAFYIVVVVSLRWGESTLPRRLWIMASSLSAIVVVLYAVQMSLLLFLLSASAGLAWRRRGNWRPARVLVVTTISLGVILCVWVWKPEWFSPLGDFAPLMYFAGVGKDLETYTALWGAGLKDFLHRPLLGYGWGHVTFVESLPRRLSHWEYVHNIYIELLVKGGLVLFAGWSALLWKSLRRNGARTQLPPLVWATIVGFLVAGMFQPFLGKVALAPLFWSMVGLTAAQKHHAFTKTVIPVRE